MSQTYIVEEGEVGRREKEYVATGSTERDENKAITRRKDATKYNR